MGKTKFRNFTSDFETTVYEGQKRTDVWAAATVELFTEEVAVTTSIYDWFDHLKRIPGNLRVYFHNLKFDGTFILNFLMDNGFTEASVPIDGSTWRKEFLPDKKMLNRTYTYSISDRGQWYKITIKLGRRIIKFVDSLKLLPLSVKRIGESFGTKHKKTSIEYKGRRYPGGSITEQEKEYIKNDVLVVKEAIEIMLNQGHDKMTIGSCCMAEFRSAWSDEGYGNTFPNQYELKFDDKTVPFDSAGAYVHKSYHGGWCYGVPEKMGKKFKNGLTLDVNSLYPSMMHSMSGNVYPYGMPEYYKGGIPEIALQADYYYFVRIKTRFYLKKSRLPMIQIKGDPKYRANEWLKTSDVYDTKTGKYCRFIDRDGEIEATRVELVLTQTDYELFLEQYDVEEFEILDCVYYKARSGMFDDYIDKYKEIKMNSKGAVREIAKLFLNNLYGKLAASINSSYKLSYRAESGELKFYTVEEYDKEPGYIPCGSAITSYARNFTIRAAQANYYGPRRKGFIYADTDSLHMDLPLAKVKGVNLHKTEFCCWDDESHWDTGFFARQKTYIEIEGKDWGTPETKFNIKCAGMPDTCKGALEADLRSGKKQLSDFAPGLQIPGKLMPKQFPGGTVLVDTTFTMKRGA